MAIDNIRKINVRSPYYINVTKPVSEGGEGDEPDVEPTEPITTLTYLDCGTSKSVGVDIGTHTYEFSALQRELGDYTITLSNIKVPIKYRIGIRGNMPQSFTTSGGWSTYESRWENATGESVTLSDSASAPNGVTETVTYTSTQSDIDTYGTVINLEIQQPIETVTGYSVGLSCPPEESSSAVDFGTNVVVIHLYNAGNADSVVNPPNRSHTFNGQDADWLVVPPPNQYATYIFADHFANDLTPPFSDMELYRNYNGLNIPFDSPNNDVTYRPASDLYKVRNSFEFNFETGNDFGNMSPIEVFISTHRIEDLYIGNVLKKVFFVSDWGSQGIEKAALVGFMATGLGDHQYHKFEFYRTEISVGGYRQDYLTSAEHFWETYYQNNQNYLTFPSSLVKDANPD